MHQFCTSSRSTNQNSNCALINKIPNLKTKHLDIITKSIYIIQLFFKKAQHSFIILRQLIIFNLLFSILLQFQFFIESDDDEFFLFLIFFLRCFYFFFYFRFFLCTAHSDEHLALLRRTCFISFYLFSVLFFNYLDHLMYKPQGGVLVLFF